MVDRFSGVHWGNETDELFCKLVEEWTRKLQAGESVDLTQYLRMYPHHATKVNDLFPAVQVLADLGTSATSCFEVGSPAGDSRSGVLGDFRILGQIGRGGMGVVYEAEQISLVRRVALKVLPFTAVLDSKQLQRFKNEAIAAASLDHPNIVPVYSVNQERGVHYYAMRLIEGQTLAQLIDHMRSVDAAERRRSTLSHAGDHDGADDEWEPLNRPGSNVDTKPIAALTTHTSTTEHFHGIARLGLQAASGLQHAHEMGLVHRDVKPSNLLVNSAGHLWIADFGLARMPGDSTLTITGELLGTLRYMSPEQAAGGHSDHRTDLFSLGATLYELLTLRPPFEQLDRQKLLRQIEQEEPTAPRQVNAAIPKDLETIVLKSMAKDTTMRYQSARDIMDDLQRFLDQRPILARRSTRLEHAWRWCRRNSAVATLAAILGCLLLFLSIAGPVTAWKYKSLLAVARTEAARAQENEERIGNYVAQGLAEIAQGYASGGPNELHSRINLYQELVKDDSTNQEYLHSLAFAYTSLAQSLDRMDRSREAEAYVKQALELWERLTKTFTPTAEDLVHYAHCRGLYGRMLGFRYALPEAEIQFRRSIDLHQRALSIGQFELPLAQGPLAFTKGQLGIVLNLGGAYPEGVSYLSDAIKTLEEIAGPGDTNLRARLGFHWRDLSNAQLALGRIDEAEESLISSLQLAKAVSTKQPFDNELGTVCYRLGSLYHATNRRPEAQDFFQQARQRLERHVEAHPDSDSASRRLVALLSTCPDVRMRNTDLAVLLAEKSAQSAPEHGRYWHLLGVAQC